jgi:hypothetical protein
MGPISRQFTAASIVLAAEQGYRFPGNDIRIDSRLTGDPGVNDDTGA